jgi:hypothetical protein
MIDKYHEDPGRYFDPLCAAVAAGLDDAMAEEDPRRPLRGEDVAEDVRSALGKGAV